VLATDDKSPGFKDDSGSLEKPCSTSREWVSDSLQSWEWGLGVVIEFPALSHFTRGSWAEERPVGREGGEEEDWHLTSVTSLSVKLAPEQPLLPHCHQAPRL